MWEPIDDDLELESLRPPGLSNGEWGLLLCQIGLMQVFTASDVQRDDTILRYFLDGKLRAVAQTAAENPGIPHGPFSVFYKDGQSLWIKGEYRNGRRFGEWEIFLPDGRKAEPLDRGFH